MGKGLQGLRGIGGRLNICLTAFEERSGGRQDDKIHHQVRQEHSNINVPSGVSNRGVGRPATLGASHAAEADLFFHFLIGLPEKKIGRNRGPKDRYQHRQKI